MTDNKQFVHLHVHSEYSLLDGATRIPALLKKCVELGMSSVAITDHGNMYAAWQFYHQAVAMGIKPILGCEFYMCEDLHRKSGDDRDRNHLIILAKNDVGYKNLVKLSSISFVDGFYYKPRIDFATLKEHSEGLICLSACIVGELPQLIAAGRIDDAKALALQYKEVFGQDYYIEIQNHNIPEEKMIMPQLVALADELGIEIVITNDVHYLNEEDAEMQDVMMCINMGKFYDQPDRLRLSGEGYYFKDYDEMAKLFPGLERGLENTVKIAQKCNVTLKKEVLLPKYVPDNGMDAEQYLRYLVDEGLKKRKMEKTKEVQERLDYELNTIISMGFVDYFLIVWDFIHYAKTNGIAVGPGRGSGAASLVAYLIEITDIQPFKYGLFFERFLNPQRQTMPDFDIDFCALRRQEVIDYVHKKYGSDNVSQIVTFGTMATKNAIRDVARVMRLSFAESSRLAGYVPTRGKINLKRLLGEEPYPDSEKNPIVSQELIEAQNNPATRKVIEIAKKLEGSPRQTGMHAAGVVICSDKISNHVPLQRNGEFITTQFDMNEVQQAGMLKMDFLGLTNVTDIQNACKYVLETKGEVVDFSSMDYNDSEVFKLISSGDTMCVFQLESSGMSDLMKRLKPNSLEEIIAAIALYRPGPMQYIPKYIEGKRDKSTISYEHPMLESILSLTNGCVVYQEQVMQICQKLAGFSFAMADNVRYAMAKKKLKLMQELGELFVFGGKTELGEIVPGCVNNGIDEKVASAIYNQLNDFSSYAFNKAHATCYAYITYQTAYLKRYHLVEFLCSMLNNRITKADDIKKYIEYAVKVGVKILPPDINKSKAYFSVENGAIRFGLGAIKAIGVNAVDEVVKIREGVGKFNSLEDLFEKCYHCFNKRTIENLIKAGAFDCFDRTRADMLMTYNETYAQVTESAKNRASGQMSLFDLMPEWNEQINAVKNDIPEFPKDVIYANEKEVFGFYFSGSPLDDYDKFNAVYHFDFNTKQIAKVEQEDETEQDDSGEFFIDDFSTIEVDKQRRSVVAGGILRNIRLVRSKDGKQMAFCTLEDNFGEVEVGIFEPAFSKCQNAIVEDTFVVVKGSVGPTNNGEYRLTAREVLCPTTDMKRTEETVQEVTLWIKMESKDSVEYEQMLEILSNYPGTLPVKLKIGEKVYSVSMPVRKCNGIEAELKDLLGEQNVVFYSKK